MLVDFQHHYTPPELMEIGKGDGSLRLDENRGSELARFGASQTSLDVPCGRRVRAPIPRQQLVDPFGRMPRAG